MNECIVCGGTPAPKCPMCKARHCAKCYPKHERLHVQPPVAELDDPSEAALAYQERRDQELKDESHER